MKINLKNGDSTSFTKKFPMNVFEIRDTLDRLKIPDDKPIVQFEISEHDNMEFPFALCLSVACHAKRKKVTRKIQINLL